MKTKSYIKIGKFSKKKESYIKRAYLKEKIIQDRIYYFIEITVVWLFVFYEVFLGESEKRGRDCNTYKIIDTVLFSKNVNVLVAKTSE